mmetsp:Transcript_3043/g.4745  ORF Transcript_3043/g.4745 Transcript_3043/m.4745 type:complete len:380 (-) Transcript_3043:326-1465(-)
MMIRRTARISARCMSTATKVSATGLDIISPTIGLNDDRLEFYNLARSFADNELKPHASAWDRESTFPVETFKKLGELGLGGIFVKEDVGGTALSRADAVSIVEGLATGCVGTTAMLTIHNMCAWVVDKFGSEQQRNEWVPKIVTMDLLISFCLTEPGSGSDAGSLSTKAEYDAGSDEFVLNGSKVFISGAGLSDLYLVMCRTGEKEISCVVVPKGTPGLSFGAKEDKMGWNCQPTRQVNFEDVRVPASNLLGQRGEGFKIAMIGLDGGRLSIGACSLGAAQACFETALAYTKERKQFQKPIAEFQATQFKLADMAGKIISARHMLRNSAAMLDEGHPAASAHCALAKKIATDQGKLFIVAWLHCCSYECFRMIIVIIYR